MQKTSLVPVLNGTINNVPSLLCNARDLHKVLGSKRQFANWIKERIDSYGFTEGEDFLTNLLKTASSKGGRSKTEYRLTIGMGKELAMLENNEQGRIARRYFIECERKMLAQQSLPFVQHTALPGGKPNFGNTRWRLNFDEVGHATLSIIPDGTMMVTREKLLDWVQREEKHATPFSVEYIQQLASACIQRLSKEANRWEMEYERLSRRRLAS